MIGRHLGEATGSGLGDLIAFNTAGRVVGGATGAFTTLIDGPTFNLVDARYTQPHSVIYRKNAASAADDTLLILMNPSASPREELEFWIDTAAHPSGNPNYLSLKGAPISAPRGWNGQQDDASGHVWFAALRGGIHGLLADDTTFSFENGAQWTDADSPPFQFCNEPFADADGDSDVDMDDFGAFQLCYTGANPGIGTLCGCFDRQKDDDIDAVDFNAFIECATRANVPWSQALTPNCVP
jgi:hypothetical protein